MKICEFTMPEIRFILAVGNFTEDENILFLLRCDDVPLEECAEEMNVSVSTVYRINKAVKIKIEKVIKELIKEQ